jgi:hypothetical protein
MATKGYTPKGAVLSIGTPGTGETFTSILQVKSISITPAKTEFDDMTNLGSPTFGNVVIKEPIPVSVTPGSFTAQAIYLPSDTGLAALRAAFSTQALQDFKLQLPPDTFGGQTTTGDLIAFSGYVMEQPITDTAGGPDKILVYKISATITTVPVITPGS